jgi:hypothetical protein
MSDRSSLSRNNMYTDLMQQEQFIDVPLARQVSGVHAHHQERLDLE